MSGAGGERAIRFATRQERTAAFNRQGLWPRIYARELREVVVAERATTEPVGGRTQIVKHYDGKVHMATTHRVVDRDGRVLHWDEKDCLLPDGTKLARKG